MIKQAELGCEAEAVDDAALGAYQQQAGGPSTSFAAVAAAVISPIVTMHWMAGVARPSQPPIGAGRAADAGVTGEKTKAIV